VIVRAEAAATATVVPPAAQTAKEHEELQKYGVFKLSYSTANVGAFQSAAESCCGCRNSVLIALIYHELHVLQEDPSLTKNWQKTVKVAVTGASGQISNHLLFMVRTASRDQLMTKCLSLGDCDL
jgi:hypothetical protein